MEDRNRKGKRPAADGDLFKGDERNNGSSVKECFGESALSAHGENDPSKRGQGHQKVDLFGDYQPHQARGLDAEPGKMRFMRVQELLSERQLLGGNPPLNLEAGNETATRKSKSDPGHGHKVKMWQTLRDHGIIGPGDLRFFEG